VKDVFARPGLPSFDYLRPETVDEVVRLLHKEGEAVRPMMGGTDLLPGLREGMIVARAVVDVKHLPGMAGVGYDPARGLTVGAATTMNALAQDPIVRTHYPLLAQAAEAVASYQIRNRATLGGNLCNASPCADTAPATLVLDAEFHLQGAQGERWVQAADFFRGPGQTALGAGEIMTAIRFPPSLAPVAARYLKLGRCRTGDLALVGVAVMIAHDGTDGGYQFRIGLGSVAPTPLRVQRAEDLLAAHEPGEEAFAAAAELAMATARPITDVRGTADYQRAMVRTLTLRGLRQVWERIVAAQAAGHGETER
jgi:carbon-monoxide dehydrogenase medium subunit